MRRRIFLITFLMTVGISVAQESSSSETSLDPSYSVPSFDASLSIGFNYDLLNDPCRVSFDYPRGYIGLNIPFKYGLGDNITSKLTAGLADTFEDGEEFRPTASARQNANYTISVDVPMLGGVCSFSNVQNFYMKYANTLGEPNVDFGFSDDVVEMFMRGMIGVPLSVSLGWETMTFGYAYKVSDKLRFAVNLHRHVFKFDLRAEVNVDLLGYFGFDIPDLSSTGNEEADAAMQSAADNLASQFERKDINYSSQDVRGDASGHYVAEVWSPTFSIHYWRFGLISRFGVTTDAPGYLKASYSLPFFIDPETFEFADMSDQDYMIDNLDNFLNSKTDSIKYESDKYMHFTMPSGHTLTFDIIPEKFWISYTKLFGQIAINVSNIRTIKSSQDTSSDSASYEEDADFDLGISVDHIVMLHGNFQNAFINIGVLGVDVDFGDKTDLLEDVLPVSYGGGALIPVLNFGTTMGAKLQLQLELDLLPLTAIKTGIVYNF